MDGFLDEDTGIDWIGMFGHMFIMLIMVWSLGSIVIFGSSHVLDRGKWKCSQLTNGECSRYDRPGR